MTWMREAERPSLVHHFLDLHNVADQMLQLGGLLTKRLKMLGNLQQELPIDPISCKTKGRTSTSASVASICTSEESDR